MVRDIVIISLMTSILFAQEELLSFIPNVQFTFFLIILYASIFGFKKTFLIVLLHVILDNLFMGTFNLFTIVPQLLCYTLLVFVVSFLKIKNSVALAFIAALFSIIYTLLMVPFGMMLLDVDFITYIKADILYTGILICVNFLVTLWLFNPLHKVLKNLYNNYSTNENNE